MAVGASVFVTRWRGRGRRHHHHHRHDHHHDHDHNPRARSRPRPRHHGVERRGLLGVGVAAGLLPCPSALVVLLSAIALHRVGFGLALIVAFSLGLAATITSIGLRRGARPPGLRAPLARGAADSRPARRERARDPRGRPGTHRTGRAAGARSNRRRRRDESGRPTTPGGDAHVRTRRPDRITLGRRVRPRRPPRRACCSDFATRRIPIT